MAAQEHDPEKRSQLVDDLDSCDLRLREAVTIALLISGEVVTPRFRQVINSMMEYYNSALSMPEADLSIEKLDALDETFASVLRSFQDELREDLRRSTG
jgi:hypothetical protein